ncbi:hypothetical protein LTR27_010493 [Elasticomyces elasticus]|nr:hypothetical protein LTR27_010493 [Elasticomyces elasticus]
MARRPYSGFSLCRGVLVIVTIWLVSLAFLGHRKIPVGSLTKEVIENGSGVGGRWYIPPSWLQRLELKGQQCSLTPNSSILDAAECAFKYAIQEPAFLNNSRIPLIIHQTWRNLEPKTWNDVVRGSVEVWLTHATGDDEVAGEPAMAYFLWNDEGLANFIGTYEPDLLQNFQRLPYPVEKSDVFRVNVLKWFGGIYGDLDTRPLVHPYNWIHDSDLTSWTDASTGAELTMHTPHQQSVSLPSHVPVSYRGISGLDNLLVRRQYSVNAIFGIGADNPPDPNPSYWRMGYTYPVQINNWALCMAPHHPIANQFLATFNETVMREINNLPSIDPLDITGPPALTTAIIAVAHGEHPTLSWDALSARNGDPEGGRGKIVAGDVLILPITGFTPGRGRFQNMGSQGLEHTNARLRHAAMGSWRKTDLKVHYGKLCRVVFGRCRDWSKIPDV